MRCPVAHPMCGACEDDEGHSEQSHHAFKSLSVNGQRWDTMFVWVGPEEVL